MMSSTRVTPVTAYRRTTRATERYMEERLWQRALRRLEGPAKPVKHKSRTVSSFAAVLRAVQGKLGRYVDIYV
ncbi:hypothetical protein [Ferrovibrio terrae]|uniref:hypothetical protein n=1 Tax=Ferrovibrio terrae TaxID=2594003 RepID=UPI0031378997